MGSALGAAILSTYTHHGHAFPTVGGFRTALVVASALCLVTAVISYVLPGRQANRPLTEEADDLVGPVTVMEEESEVVGAGLMLGDEQVPLPARTEAP